MASAPDPALDPRRLLEMALERMPASPDRRGASADEVSAAFPQFEIFGLVGSGGMGAVYKVRDKKMGRVAALKVLPKERAAEPEFVERFAREARAQAALSHPNILAVHDFGNSNGFCYLLTELVDGVDLRQLLAIDGPAPAEALRIIPQICDALQYAHDQGVVHRDIKPENILIDQRGHVRLADFGLAKLLGDDPGWLTRSAQPLGTPHYMAPEQLRRSAEVDHRADIFALGVVLYEMLTGQLPVGYFAPPSTTAQTHPGLDQVVLRALAQGVEQRYQNARDVKSDLQRTANEPATSEPSRLCKGPLVGLAGTLIVLIAGSCLAYFAVADEDFRGDEGKLQLLPLLGVVGAVILVVVMWRGFAATRRIRASRGALRGLGMALCVAWLPALALADLAIVGPLAWLGTDVGVMAASFAAMTLLVLNTLFLRWQYRRHLALVPNTENQP